MANNDRQTIRLYFDLDRICIGGVANEWWQENFSGDYWASDYFDLPVGYDPVGKRLSELQKFPSAQRSR